MTLEQFNKKNEMEQIETILLHGLRIAERQDKDLLIVLYQIDSFYVESIFVKASMRKIGNRGFEDVEGLLPYADKLNKTELKMQSKTI